MYIWTFKCPSLEIHMYHLPIYSGPSRFLKGASLRNFARCPLWLGIFVPAAPDGITSYLPGAWNWRNHFGFPKPPKTRHHSVGRGSFTARFDGPHERSMCPNHQPTIHWITSVQKTVTNQYSQMKSFPNTPSHEKKSYSKVGQSFDFKFAFEARNLLTIKYCNLQR